jgi:hypothetical protein
VDGLSVGLSGGWTYGYEYDFLCICQRYDMNTRLLDGLIRQNKRKKGKEL